MEDTPPNENPKKDFNKIDLTQLQSFSFGTQWAQDKTDPADRSSGREREGRRDDRPRREGAPTDPRRDRRAFRKPAGAGQPAEGGERREGRGEFAGGGGGGFRGPRPEGGGFRGPRPDGGGFRGPRPEGAGAPRGMGRGEGGGFRGPRGGGPMERGPYISPFFDVTFYPEDVSFTALAKTIRASCRTFELFDIARTVIGKNDRFVVVVQRKPAGSAPRAGEGGDATPAPGGPKASFYLSVPDGLLFETEDAALSHVLQNHLGQFFDTAEAEVEPPKGSFQVINKCGVTGELLGPPNYHRYNQIVQQHHAMQLQRMPFEAFRARIETVRDPEVVNQWLEKMKKVTRYTWKSEQPAPAAPAAPAAQPAPEGEATGAESTPAEEAPAPGVPAITFDNLEDARTYLVTRARDKAVRAVDSGRFHGKALETMPESELKHAVEGALERQRRFPLDTANALRGRLRREGFTIFKKGSKGVSYVCAVKRKFRVPGQTFASTIGELIGFVEAHPMVKASELPEKFLGLNPAATAEGTADAESMQKLSRLQGDLRWLVTEGYVTEFMDGSLFAAPPLADAKKSPAGDDADQETDFPEAKPAEAAASAEQPAPSAEPAPGAAEAVPSADETTSSTVADEPSTAEPVAESAVEPAEEPKKGDGSETAVPPA